MKNLLIASVACLFLLEFFSPSVVNGAGGDKSSALKKIDALIENGGNNEGLRLIKHYAQNAEYNYDSIAEIARLTSEFGYHTMALVQVAKIASETNYECKYFAQIARLVLRHLTETSRVVDLAQQAKYAHTESERRALEKAIIKVEQECELKSLDEARQYQEKQRHKK